MDQLKLALVGDIMLGDHPVCYGHGVRSQIRRLGLSTLLGDAAAMIKSHDAFLGNLECVLSHNLDDSDLKSSELRGDPESAPFLNMCNHNVLNIANNHILQHGESAYFETCAALKAHNIEPVGQYIDGDSNVVTITKGDVTVAVIGSSFRPEHFCKKNIYYAHHTPEGLLKQVSELKTAHPDYHIVVSLHWGEEYLHTPSYSQIGYAHQLIDLGASVIAGHHPHVLQGIEEYKSGIIAYSLGNFLFDSWQTPTKESIILTCNLKNGVAPTIEKTPIYLDKNYSISRHTHAEEIAKKIRHYSDNVLKRSDLATLDDDSYEREAAKKYLAYRLECYAYFLTRIWKYHPRVIYHSLFRSALRRLRLA